MNRKNATEEFMESIINGDCVDFPIKVEKDTELDKFLTNHPMFHQAIIKENKKFTK